MGYSNPVDPSSKTCAKSLFLTFQPKARNDGMAPNVLEKVLLHSNYLKDLRHNQLPLSGTGLTYLEKAAELRRHVQFF